MLNYAHTIKRISQYIWSCTFKCQDSTLNGTPLWNEIETQYFATRKEAAEWGASQGEDIQDEIEEPCECGEPCCNMGETCSPCREAYN